MSIPKLRDEPSGISDRKSRQSVSNNEDAGNRIRKALDGREISWLVRETGFGDSTIRDAIKRGPARADVAVAIARALNVSTDWLLCGTPQSPSAAVVAAIDAEWIDVTEHDLRELDDKSRGPVVSVTPFRKDWLHRTLGQSGGLWIGRLPADLPRAGLAEGDPVFLRDVDPGEAQDGAIYIVRVWGHLTVARLDALLSASMSSIDSNLDDRRLGFRDIGIEDGKAVLVARVLGAPLRRL